MNPNDSCSTSAEKTRLGEGESTRDGVAEPISSVIAMLGAILNAVLTSNSSSNSELGSRSSVKSVTEVCIMSSKFEVG